MALPKSIPYVDGWCPSPGRELTVGLPPTLPFADAAVSDIYTREFLRQYEITPLAYQARIATRYSWRNGIAYSGDLGNALGWSTFQITATSSAGTSPDGSTALTKLLETAVNNSHSINAVGSALSAAPTEVHIFAKGGLGRDWIYVEFTDVAATTFGAFFNISAGYVGSLEAGTTAKITSLGNGFFFCRILFTPAAGDGTFYLGISTDGSTRNYLGDITKGVYAWGAGLVVGTNPPYIPTTTLPRTISAPERDPIDPMSYLVTEASPAPLNSSVSVVAALFSRIPNDQISYTTLPITKPSVPNQSTGSTTFVRQDSSSDAGVTLGTGPYYSTSGAYLFPPNQEVYGPLLSVSRTAAVSPSGGTFKIGYKANQTAALAYNASQATINAAINGLASVIADGLTVAWNNAGGGFVGNIAPEINITVGSTSTRFAIDATGLTGVTLALGFTYVASSIRQAFTLADKYSITGHGFDAAQPLAAAVSTVATASTTAQILQPVTSWSVVDANTIAVINATGTYSGFSYPTGSLFSSKRRNYTAGPDRVRCKLVESYYLPGVTAGITTGADIPVADPLLNDTAFLAAVLTTPTGYVTYDTEALKAYKGPIYTQTAKQIDMSDV